MRPTRSAAAAALAGALFAAAAGGAAAAPPSAEAARAAALAQGLPLTPQMFGAAGDGRTDDTAAIERWLSSGRPLFCSGTFRVTRGVTAALKPDGGLFLQGAGRQLCKIVLAAPTAGITVRGGTPDIYGTPQVVIHDLSLAPAAVLTRPALDIGYTGGSGSTDPTLDLRDVAVKPTAQAFYAPTCIRLTNVRNGVAAAINCEGRRGRYLPGSRGIAIAGDAQPVELTLRDVNTYFMDEGIALAGTWQGVSINEAVCVPCRVGVKATASDNNGVWLRINDSHFNVEDFGVEAVNIATVDVRDSFTYLHAVGASDAPFHACVSITMLSQATAWAKVQGNTCDGTQLPASPRYGVLFDSARPPSTFLTESRIDGNSFYGLEWGVFLKNATAVSVGANTYAAMTQGTIFNGSSGSGVFGNRALPKEEALPSGRN